MMMHGLANFKFTSIHSTITLLVSRRSSY